MHTYLPWMTLALLGAYHGLNPAMGWLFAVGLGLQEQKRSAVVNAFVPIALGHALSIAMVVTLLGVLQQIMSPSSVAMLSAGVLLVFGAYRIGANAAHPRWVGMRVNFRDLMAWSFLMSTAHGAGLMLAPVLLKFSAGGVVQPVGMDHMHGEHAEHMVASMGLAASMGLLPNTQLLAVGVHTAAMFAVMAMIALLVYEKLGLHLLRRAWFNLDFLWTGALLLAGVLTLFSASV